MLAKGCGRLAYAHNNSVSFRIQKLMFQNLVNSVCEIIIIIPFVVEMLCVCNRMFWVMLMEHRSVGWWVCLWEQVSDGSLSLSLLPFFWISFSLPLFIIAVFFFIGKYRQGDDERISPPPVAVCEDFPAAVELILTSLNTHKQTWYIINTTCPLFRKNKYWNNYSVVVISLA